ncbi:hypothetical protein OG612_45520 (plasmid) [Streptomyces sp. NBC_01527]|uniref:hypothetical protein n=1 Tax=Streptomyces sp. NBC_01527 TaxID=2903894 RepID=UPI002F91B269
MSFDTFTHSDVVAALAAGLETAADAAGRSREGDPGGPPAPGRTPEQLAFDVEPAVAVHCFFDCGHVVREADPARASTVMEQHYAEDHASDIDQAVTSLR